MMREERYNKIYEIIKEKEIVKVSGLVDILQVSIDTVRRDLEHLESEGILKRVHGGAISQLDLNKKNDYGIREVEFKKEKEDLAAKTIHYVTEGQAIALNSGTTTIEVAKQLAKSFDKLSIITNGLKIVEVLKEKTNFNIIVPGGILDHEEYSLFGPKCEEEIAQYNIDIAFLAVNAISLEKGITDFRLNEVGVIEQMMKSSRKKIVVADSSKFDKVSYINVCELNDIDLVITDSNARPEIIQKYEDRNVNIY